MTAAHQGVPEGDVFGVDGVQGAQVRDHGIAHFVFVALTGPHAVLAQAEVGVGVDHPRNENLAAHIPDLGVLGWPDVGADRFDGPPLNEQGAILDHAVGRCHDAGAHQSQPHDFLLSYAPAGTARGPPKSFYERPEAADPARSYTRRPST